MMPRRIGGAVDYNEPSGWPRGGSEEWSKMRYSAWPHFSVISVVDILLVAVIIYELLTLIEGRALRTCWWAWRLWCWLFTFPGSESLLLSTG